MKRWLPALIGLALAGTVMATEEAKYKVIQADGDFELREYDPQVVAETIVAGDMAEAGNRAFGRLFQFISGNNLAEQKIAMTAPVGQQAATNGWTVWFVMPADHQLATTPVPKDAQVTLRQIPAQRMASVRYRGRWTRSLYDSEEQRLREWIAAQKLSPTGAAVWARYDPPFMPSFFRRNEVLIPVK